MRKVYFDKTECKECVSVFVMGAEVILAGTTVYSMQVTDKNSEYQRFADEYDIHFIFDDNMPVIDFYTVPEVDIFAADSNGGYIGTFGQQTDFDSDAPICYIDRDRNCYFAAESGRDFLRHKDDWKKHLELCGEIVFYPSKSDAEKELEFVEIPSGSSQ